MENLEFKIIDLDNNARGIAKKEGIIYFVEGAKLGEIVEAKIVKKKKNFIEAIKIKTIEESKYLSKENIDEDKLCGIYDLYDIDYRYQVQFKKDSIVNTINRIAHENIDDINFLEADRIHKYRNKLELKLSPKGDLSYFSRKSNDNIKINECIMVTKEINEVLPKLQALIHKYKLSGYNTKTNEGLIKNIILRSTSIGEVMGIVVYNEEYDFKDFYIDLENLNIFDSFYVSYNPKRRNYKMNHIEQVFGKKKIKEIMGNFEFNISPKAFFQVNRNMAYEIYLIARKYIKKLNPDLIIDMYSGVSTTSIILSDLVKKIISVEINEDAVNDAKENALINNVKNIEWMNLPSEKAIEQINLSEKRTVALFDPPRRGLDLNIIEKIGESEINNIVYISCNPATLARDISRFKEYNFNLIETTGVDQFVNTIEVECVVLMSR